MKSVFSLLLLLALASQCLHLALDPHSPELSGTGYSHGQNQILTHEKVVCGPVSNIHCDLLVLLTPHQDNPTTTYSGFPPAALIAKTLEFPSVAIANRKTYLLFPKTSPPSLLA